MRVIKITRDEDGKKENRQWCGIQFTGDSPRTICRGEVFGEGEGRAEYKEKEGKITCHRCIEVVKYYKSIILSLLIFISLNLSSQIQFTHFNDLTDFNKHRVVSTGLAWTGTIIGYKKTGEMWKGMLIGFSASMAIGIAKEGIYDGAMKRGVTSGKDILGNGVGSLTGSIAGLMCCAIQEEMEYKKQERRARKFINPLN